MSFAVQRVGELEHIATSTKSRFMQLSVSVDFTLDAGEYHVFMRIKARCEFDRSVENAVRIYAKNRPEKLTQVALKFDMAHARFRDETR